MSDYNLAEIVQLLRSDEEEDHRLAKKTLYKGGWFKDGRLIASDLSHSNLQGGPMTRAVLRGINFSESDLQNALFWDADLECADLRGADLRGADFRRANLRGACLDGALCDEKTVLPDCTENHYADFKFWTPETEWEQYTDPTHPDYWLGYGLNAQDLSDCDFSGKNLRGAYLKESNLTNVNLEDSRLQAASFVLAIMENTRARGADLRQAEFFGTHLVNAVFTGADISRAGLKQSNIEGAHFENCDLRGTKFNNSNLRNAVFVNANLEGVLFEDADLHGADFSDAHFNEHTLLPDGSLWLSDTDLERFTNSDHPSFWRPPVQPE